MSIREELTRQAERALRLGRVDEAIAQYQELAYLAPVDWGLVKQLADLLERAGQREGAARQFTRWADYLAVEGFHSKAAALYKKVLKLEPGDEHAFWQLGEVSLELKLRADARLAFQRVAEIRQRRGDAAGAAAARERLASVEGMAAAPAAGFATSLLNGTTLVPAPPPTIEAAVVPATNASAPAPEPVAPPPVAPALVAAVGVSAPVQSPVVDPVPVPVAVLPPPPAPASTRVDTPVVPAVVEAAPEPEPEPETPADRLARLRREAEAADARGDRDADAAWHAVLAVDHADAVVRLRLVRAAADRGDFDTAARLAVDLDASDDAALVALADLAYQRGRLRDLDRLMSDRVRASELPGRVLGPVDALSSRRPGAARAALAAAVRAWAAAGQPGHAAAALEQSDGRGLLTTDLHLQWVEICVDAGLPGLSRAQRALAGAYRAEHRLAEARAVAEDVFVRDGGAEPSRALLLDILEREGVEAPDRVLVELLAPPPMAAPDERFADVVEPPPSWPADADALPVDDASFAMDEDVAVLVPAVMMAESSTTLPDMAFAAPVAATREADSLAFEQTSGTSTQDAGGAAQAAVISAPEQGGAKLEFDWSDLLGRELDQWPAPVAAAAPAEVPTADGTNMVFETDDSPAPVEVPAAVPEPVAVVVAEPRQEPEATVAHDPLPAPAMAAAADTSAAADGSTPRIGDLRAQPLLANDAPLPPSFSMPKGWLSDSPATAPAEAPRRRAPEDDFFFDDDATPARWASPSIRAGGAALTSPARQVSSLEPPSAAERPIDRHESPVVDPVAAEPLAEDLAVVAEVAPSPASIEEADMSAPRDASPGPEPLPQDPTEMLPVEEEVDLTELLEELKQWDPVLPEPRTRQREEPPAEAVTADVTDGPAARQEDSVDMAETVAEATVAAAQDAEPWTPLEEHPATSEPPVSLPDAATESTELDAVFADMHRRGDDRVVAEQQLAAGRVFLAAGLVSEAARAFERASLEPRSRFGATLALAELHRSRSQMLEAVGWYEQAATAPVPDAAVKHAVLYDLAESLETLGETDRALGVLLDLLSQVEDYRDARARLDQLLRVDAGG